MPTHACQQVNDNKVYGVVGKFMYSWLAGTSKRDGRGYAESKYTSAPKYVENAGPALQAQPQEASLVVQLMCRIIFDGITLAIGV
jgi:hypothetical protein